MKKVINGMVYNTDTATLLADDWIALLSTDTNLSEEAIIRIYGKPWEIEVFFKVWKSYLKLAKEFSGLSYDSLTAHTALVYI